MADQQTNKQLLHDLTFLSVYMKSLSAASHKLLRSLTKCNGSKSDGV